MTGKWPPRDLEHDYQLSLEQGAGKNKNKNSFLRPAEELRFRVHLDSERRTYRLWQEIAEKYFVENSFV